MKLMIDESAALENLSTAVRKGWKAINRVRNDVNEIHCRDSDAAANAWLDSRNIVGNLWSFVSEFVRKHKNAHFSLNVYDEIWKMKLHHSLVMCVQLCN